MAQIKTLQVGPIALVGDPFTYIQDHLMAQIETLQVGAHFPSWGPIYLYTRPFDGSNQNSTSWGPLL